MKSLSILLLVMIMAACSSDASTARTTGETPADQQSTQVGDPDTTTTSAISIPARLGGNWNGVITHVANTGVCPSTPTQQGTVLIDETGPTFTLVFAEGFNCDPLAACSFVGTVEENEYSATNGGPADSAGGVYTTTFVLTMDAADHAAGVGTSAYSLADMTCTWDTTVELLSRQD